MFIEEFAMRIKQSRLQKKMKQISAARERKKLKKMLRENRKELTNMAKKIANNCSVKWIPNVDEFYSIKNEESTLTNYKYSIKKIIPSNIAEELLVKVKVEIRELDLVIKKIKNLFYLLERGDSFIELAFRSEADQFKEISEVSLRHLPQLQKFRKAAKIEVELGLEHDTIPTNILLEIGKNTTPATRKEIWKIINKECYYQRRDDGSYPIPTIKQLKSIKRAIYNETPEGIKRLDDYFNFSDDFPDPYGNDEYLQKYSLNEIGQFQVDKCMAFETKTDIKNHFYGDEDLLKNYSLSELDKFQMDKRVAFEVECDLSNHPYKEDEILKQYSPRVLEQFQFDIRMAFE